MTEQTTAGQTARRTAAPGAATGAAGRGPAVAKARPGADGTGLPPSPFAGMLGAFDGFVSRGLARVTGTVIAPYQSAVIRIGFSLTWLLFLLREWPHRHELYGPNAMFDFGMAERLIGSDHAFTVALWSDSGTWFEIVYALAILASLSLMLGWRTRTSAVFFMIGVLSLQNRSVFEGDGGDNVVHLMAIYLVFTRCGSVWSLDARRARRAARRATASGGPGGRWTAPGLDLVGVVLWFAGTAALVAAEALGRLSLLWGVAFGVAVVLPAVWWWLERYAPGEPRTVADMVANIVHAGAMLVIVVEVCFIYADAGWYKIQGSLWQDGTALYYPLHIQDFTPWPALAHALAANGLLVMLITYGTVAVQVAFPFTLFNRRLKNVLLVLMMCEHAGIAVILGLPFFSLAMISADAVFLPTGFLLWAGSRLTRAVTRGRGGALPGQRAGEDPATSNLVA